MKLKFFILWIHLPLFIIYGFETRNPWTRIELENHNIEHISNLLNPKEYIIDNHIFEPGQKLSIYATKDALNTLQKERMIYKVQERDFTDYPSEDYMNYEDMVLYLQ